MMESGVKSGHFQTWRGSVRGVVLAARTIGALHDARRVFIFSFVS
jgi:hypothetical protein